MNRARFSSILLAAALGCSRQVPRSDSNAESSAPSSQAIPERATVAEAASAAGSVPPPLPSATMQLLEGGRAPRRRLRYRWRVGQKEQLALDLRTAATTEVGGTKQAELRLPPIQIDIAILPDTISPEGDLRFAWHVVRAAVIEDPSVQPDIAQGVHAQVDPIQDLAGRAVVSNRGLSKEVTVDAASLGEAGAQGEMVVQVVQTLRDVAAPLPEEEVGLGARWQKLSRIDTRDAQVTQNETFTLTAIHGDAATLDDLLAQTASPQALPGGPSAPTPRMESMLTSGRWDIRASLSQLVPQMTFQGTTQLVAARTSIVTRMKIAVTGTVVGGR